MTRDQWIYACADAFVAAWGCRRATASDFAITEFNLQCRASPADDAPLLPVEQWPNPGEAAARAVREYAAMDDFHRGDDGGEAHNAGA
jgi:hypothetical protein